MIVSGGVVYTVIDETNIALGCLGVCVGMEVCVYCCFGKGGSTLRT